MLETFWRWLCNRLAGADLWEALRKIHSSVDLAERMLLQHIESSPMDRIRALICGDQLVYVVGSLSAARNIAADLSWQCRKMVTITPLEVVGIRQVVN